jgi:hypothetical protein
MATNLSRIINVEVLLVAVHMERPNRPNIGLLLGALDWKVTLDSAHSQQEGYYQSNLDQFINYFYSFIKWSRLD